MGSLEGTADAGPQVLPDLQYRGVIAVVLGDYHKVCVSLSIVRRVLIDDPT
jgi:hypothetical protein